MTKGYIDTSLSFQMFVIFWAKFSFFRNFLCLSFGKIVGQENCCIYCKCFIVILNLFSPIRYQVAVDCLCVWHV